MIRKTRCIWTGRNYALKELHDKRTYLLPSGNYVTVRTIMEMEYVGRKLRS